LPQYDEVIMIPDEDVLQINQFEQSEDGVEIPLDRINPETMRKLITEFVTREWEEIGDTHHTLDDKIEQVHQQLSDKKAKVVFDLKTETCNIVLAENNKR
jgi:uncharacterized protein YheU (UPF0270 family)